MNIAEVPLALLAGGVATRLRPITTTIPKALVEVAGRPFIDHQLALLKRNGVRRVVLCLGHLGEQVRAHLDANRGFGLEVAYSFDGERLLGTGGVLRRAAPLLGEAFWVLYGDSYLDIDYAAVLADFVRQGKPALMTVIHNRDRWDRSNVVFRDGRLLAYDKRRPTPDMAHIDYGLALLRREVLGRVPPDEPSDLADLYGALVAEGQMAGHEMTRRFYEIGSPAGLEETRALLAARETMDPEEALSLMTTVPYATTHLAEAAAILGKLDVAAIEKVVALVAALRERGGRLFFLGVGGSAANASHAVNDFRKIANVEAYAPTDNVSELTARTNDEGWEGVFREWLRVSRLTSRDMIFVLSVGGGDLERNVSPNLVGALQYAREVGATVCGIVGRDGGYTARVADACVIVPTVNPATVTPHAEAFQAVVWHLMVSHPALHAAQTKWESTR